MFCLETLVKVYENCSMGFGLFVWLIMNLVLPLLNHCLKFQFLRFNEKHLKLTHFAKLKKLSAFQPPKILVGNKVPEKSCRDMVTGRGEGCTSKSHQESRMEAMICFITQPQWSRSWLFLWSGNTQISSYKCWGNCFSVGHFLLNKFH